MDSASLVLSNKNNLAIFIRYVWMLPVTVKITELETSELYFYEAANSVQKIEREIFYASLKNYLQSLKSSFYYPPYSLQSII